MGVEEENHLSFIVKCNFIGDFKLGDNIQYNLKILKFLYKAYRESDEEDQGLLHKPITITIVSIIEALLYDFHTRIKENVREGVQGLSQNTIDYIRCKQHSKMDHYIRSAKKHDFFDLEDSDFYQDLTELSQLRNRIHIQNEKAYFHADEAKAFTKRNMALAELLLEVVAFNMHTKFARVKVANCVGTFNFPWKSRFFIKAFNQQKDAN